MQAKILKHQAFEAEIAAHNNAILTLKSTGRAMLDSHHFSAEDIKVGSYSYEQWLLGANVVCW